MQNLVAKGTPGNAGLPAHLKGDWLDLDDLFPHQVSGDFGE